MHASMTGTKPSVLVALRVTLCPLWFMKLGHYDRKMLRNPAEYDYLNQSDQTTSTAVCVIDDASTCLRTRHARP